MFMSLNGSLNIQCHENGYCLNLDFHGPGKKSTPDPFVCGALLSPSGEKLRALYGSFAEYLASCDPKEFDDNFLEFKRIFRVQYNPDSYVEAMNESVVLIDRSKLLWRAFRKPPKCNEFYKFTYFSMGLNAIDSDYESKLPGTDSRLRPDIRLMEQGEIESASDEKLRLEIRQRAENALQGKRKEQKRPRYFSALAKKDEFGRDGQWKFEGKYWERNFSGRDENLFEQ
ncbi:oxysterol-binding protein [Ditylenchus destructor]|nr:oxysterol-binding protein [Ditylenchus destructor]